jgi:polyphenol oxidase
LQAPLFIESGLVDHAFSTRLGGCSSGEFTSLNTAFHTADCMENVLENRRRFFDKFSYDFRYLVAVHQVHGSEINLFDQSHRGEGALPGSVRKECDALVTTAVDLPLTAYAADCMLIYFYSPQPPLVAIAHAGWRGALGGVGVKVVQYLKENFTVDPGRLLAALSPAICRECYVVDDSTANKFMAAGWYGADYLEKASSAGYHLDLSAVNANQLLSAGVKNEHLAQNSWCTSCRRDLFYSYRRDRGATGRMIGFIALKKAQGAV